ncbi:MAG: cupin domain-containing protein [Betaproteobacteria bacterium]|jgi:mannose-6-phosphate isomerase-like protein (cupin superfamily)|nr:cupin domain-containing protein [Betaproteobacteria bacterium]
MLEKVNLLTAANQTNGLFQYLKIGQINNHMLNVVQVENRTLDFHVHEQSDELFYVIEGQFAIELDDGMIHLEAGDMIVIPKGTRHRPVVTTRVSCLLIEIEGTLNASNTGGSTQTEHRD